MQFFDLEEDLSVLNMIVGAIIIIYSIVLYFRKRVTAPVYITLAIVTAGPLEDILMEMVKNRKDILPGKKQYYYKLIDQLTSLGFLIFLMLAVIKSAKTS